MSLPGIPQSPNLKTCDKEVLALVKYLRRNETLKQRSALLAGQRWDMFRAKRAVRALLDPAYEKARKKTNSGLPEISDREAALRALARFPPEHFAINVTKLETEDALSKGLKPQSGVPVVLISQQQRIGDDEYLIWLHNPTPISTYLYAMGVLGAGGAMALFQLWPTWARQGAYHVSVLCMILVGSLIGLGVIRIILFLITFVLLRTGFWLFPNLFADVSFFQSFQPLYSWGNTKTLPVKPKLKKRKAKAVHPVASTLGAAAAAGPGRPPQGAPLMRMTPNGPVPVNADGTPATAQPNGPNLNNMPPVVQQALMRSMARAEERLKQELANGNTESPQLLRTKLLKEEWSKEESVLVAAAKAQ